MNTTTTTITTTTVAERLARLSPEQQQAALRRLKPGLFKSAAAASGPAVRGVRAFRPGTDPNFSVQVRVAGLLDSLEAKLSPRHDLLPNDVEIEVHAASLNFRDVMIALGMYPLFEGDARPAFGFDCSGVVSAVGSAVTHFKVGDEVMGFPYPASGCFSRYTSADEASFMPKPPYLSHQEAAANIGVLITAYYALCEVGRLSKDERVLIHQAAGGVGLAAVQVAQWIGAEIYATTSNEEKRAFLRARGVTNLMDSRSLSFVEETLERTGGEGVDLILNSLPGEAINKGMTLLRQYGRFLELGRKDVIEDRALGMAIFDQALLFATVNISFKGEMRTRINAGLMRLLDERLFAPLPMKVFPISAAGEAFAYMSSGKHIGKIVLQVEGVPVELAVA